MATYTSFLNLEKPTTSERLDVLKINSNWDKIDEGVSSLNSKLANKLSILVVTENNVSLNAGEHKNIAVAFTSPGNVQAVVLLQSPNSAYIVGSAVAWSADSATIGLYNTASSAVTGNLVIGVLYK